jgi:hypothetical protein
LPSAQWIEPLRSNFNRGLFALPDLNAESSQGFCILRSLQPSVRGPCAFIAYSVHLSSPPRSTAANPKPTIWRLLRRCTCPLPIAHRKTTPATCATRAAQGRNSLLLPGERCRVYSLPDHVSAPTLQGARPDTAQAPFPHCHLNRPFRRPGLRLLCLSSWINL